LLDGVPLGPAGLHAYFVHSYHLRAADPADLVADSDYGGPVTALVGRGNYAGTQFPPGKEPETWACVDREFPQVEALNHPAPRAPR